MGHKFLPLVGLLEHFIFDSVLLRGTAMLQSHSRQTNEISLLFFKDSYYSLNFFPHLILIFFISVKEREYI